MVLKALIRIYDQNTLKLKLEFPFANTVDIVNSRNSYTDTCQIILPQRTRRVNIKISDAILIGDPIEVYLGYAPNIQREFQGYVTRINPDSPMTLECEDISFKYKNKAIGTDYVLTNTTFEKLLSTIYDGELLTTKTNIGTWKISKNATVLDVLDSLKKTFTTPCYWQNNILHVNYEFQKAAAKKVLFDVQKNVPLGQDKLDINTTTNLNIISHGISAQKDGTKFEVFAYYENLTGKRIKVTQTRPPGVLNTFNFQNLTLQGLKDLVSERLPRLYYAGLTGEITGITPSFTHGDLAAIRNTRTPEQNGVYDVPEVRKSFSVESGYKHIAKIGLKYSDFS